MFLIIKIIRAVIRRVRNFITTFLYSFFFKSMGKRTKVFHGFYCSNPRGVIIGNDCIVDVDVCMSTEFKNSYIKIGNNVKINQGVNIDYSGDVIIEDNALISKDTYILSHSHGYDPRSAPVKRPLIIEKNAWIGAKVIICENVEIIGEGAIIASGSIVTKSIEAHTIVGGNPAKFIKRL